MKLFLVACGAVGLHGLLLGLGVENLLGHHYLALTLKLERHGSRKYPRLPPAWLNAERTSAAVRLRLSVRHSTYHRHARGAVAFVDDVLVHGGIGTGTKSLVDGGLNLVLGHGLRLGLSNSGGKRGVVLGIRIVAQASSKR